MIVLGILVITRQENDGKVSSLQKGLKGGNSGVKELTLATCVVVNCVVHFLDAHSIAASGSKFLKGSRIDERIVLNIDIPSLVIVKSKISLLDGPSNLRYSASALEY